jgi:hypothetical protein
MNKEIERPYALPSGFVRTICQVRNDVRFLLKGYRNLSALKFGDDFDFPNNVVVERRQISNHA